MKNLPVIESDYPLFSWEESNGSATAEQTQRAYTAITTKGQTADFSRFVWNDLVDKAYYAVKASGAEWSTEDYFLTPEETKIKSKYDPLTSAKFNTLASNISLVLGNSWKWSYMKNVPGYIGRTRVVGVSDIGQLAWAKAADPVYGWYIEEIARSLNVFLKILKNEADFSELGNKRIFLDSAVKADARAPKAAKIKSEIPVRSAAGAKLRSSEAKHLVPMDSTICKIDSTTALICGKPKRFAQTDLAIIRSKSTTKLTRKTPKRLDTWYLIGVDVNATLRGLMYVGRMFSRMSFHSNALLDMTVAEHKLLALRANLHSNAKAQITSGKLKRMEIRENAVKTLAFDKLEKIPAKQLADGEMKISSKSEVHTNVISREAKHLSASSCGRNTANYAKLVPLVPTLMFFMDSCGSVSEIKMTPGKPKYLGKTPGNVASLSKTLVELIKSVPKRMDARTECTIDSLATLISASPVHMLSNTKSVITSLSELIPAKPAYVLGNTKSVITSLSELIPVKPAWGNADANSASNSLAEIHKAEPKLLYVACNSGICSKTLLDKIETLRMKTIAGLSGTSCIGKISRRVPRNIGANLRARSGAIATLSFYGKQPELWHDPVRSGNDLYIRNVWEQHDEEVNVHIGHKFYGAEQNGTVLHIRSIYTGKSADGNMDLGFKYYEPIQENGNIYIRSIENLKKEE